MANVLVVDDEMVVLHVMTWMLEKFGHKVWRAANANQALEVLGGSTSFDLAIIDLVLPGVSGIELARTVRERYEALPMIAMSGYVSPESTATMAALDAVGIVRFIPKPVRVLELYSAVNTALAKSG